MQKARNYGQQNERNSYRRVRESVGQYLTSIGEEMSNSFADRKKTTVLEAFEALFNERDYAAAERFRSPNYIQHGALIPAGRWSTRASSPVVRSRNVLKKNSMRFAVALLVALASFVAGPNAALAATAQHHDQVPGFYRLKVGDLEVTALFDGTGVFDPHWLNGTNVTMDGVVRALHEDPHMLDVVDTGFLVNTGKQLILVDAGAGTWWGGGSLGRLAGSLRSAGYTPEEVDLVLVTHLHSDHVGGLTTQDGKRVFPNADVYVAKAESDFWLSPEIAAKGPKDAQPFFQSAQAVAAPYINAGKWHTFSGSEPIVDGMRVVPLPGHTPGHTGYEFSSKGQKILFWGDIVHAQRVQLQHPEVTAIFDIDQTAAAATRHQLLSKLAREGVLIATPHTSLFPALGRLREEGSGYSWVPVVFTDQWDDK
jgi:glyoxylase-like metal-dependent hydrolase (beta-lactamase superfamily II)